MEYQPPENDSIKIKIADVILNLNECESMIKLIIVRYTRTQREHFVQEILLNNGIINFGAKVRVLFHIMNELKIEPVKGFKVGLQELMNKRNALAHSDSILEDFGLINDPDSLELKVRFFEPETATIGSNGKLNAEKYGELFEKFDGHYNLVKQELFKISWQLDKPIG